MGEWVSEVVGEWVAGFWWVWLGVAELFGAMWLSASKCRVVPLGMAVTIPPPLPSHARTYTCLHICAPEFYCVCACYRTTGSVSGSTKRWMKTGPCSLVCACVCARVSCVVCRVSACVGESVCVV